MGHAYQYTVPSFSDPDGDSLLLRASQAGAGSALPGWLAFDEPTGTLSGTPPRVGERVAVHVTATDEDLLAAGDLPCDPDRDEADTEMNPPRLCTTVTFALSVVANQPPVAPDLTELVLDRRSYTQEFTVAFQDEGELTFQVAPADGQALPEWLNPRIPLPSDMLNEVYFSIAIDLAFDAMARPACVVVTATDQGGLSASVIFAAFLSDNPSRENPCSGVEPPSPPRRWDRWRRRGRGWRGWRWWRWRGWWR